MRIWKYPINCCCCFFGLIVDITWRKSYRKTKTKNISTKNETNVFKRLFLNALEKSFWYLRKKDLLFRMIEKLHPNTVQRKKKLLHLRSSSSDHLNFNVLTWFQCYFAFISCKSFLPTNRTVVYLLFFFLIIIIYSFKYTISPCGWHRLRQSQPSAVAVLEKATGNQPTKIYFNVTKIIS